MAVGSSRVVAGGCRSLLPLPAGLPPGMRLPLRHKRAAVVRGSAGPGPLFCLSPSVCFSFRCAHNCCVASCLISLRGQLPNCDLIGAGLCHCLLEQTIITRLTMSFWFRAPGKHLCLPQRATEGLGHSPGLARVTGGPGRRPHGSPCGRHRLPGWHIRPAGAAVERRFLRKCSLHSGLRKALDKNAAVC